MCPIPVTCTLCKLLGNIDARHILAKILTELLPNFAMTLVVPDLLSS